MPRQRAPHLGEGATIPAWQEPCSSPYFFLYSREGRRESKPQPCQCMPAVRGASRGQPATSHGCWQAGPGMPSRLEIEKESLESTRPQIQALNCHQGRRLPSANRTSSPRVRERSNIATVISGRLVTGISFTPEGTEILAGPGAVTQKWNWWPSQCGVSGRRPTFPKEALDCLLPSKRNKPSTEDRRGDCSGIQLHYCCGRKGGERSQVEEN